MNGFAIQPSLGCGRTRSDGKTRQFIGRSHPNAWLGVDQDAVSIHQETIIELLVSAKAQIMQKPYVRVVILLRVGDVDVVVRAGDPAEAGIDRPAAFQP